MRNTRLLAGMALGLAVPHAVLAQPADLPIPAATTTTYPPGVTVRQTPAGPVYADARGRTLYGMDMRTLHRWAPNPALYCKDDCARLWEPLLAPAGSEPNIMYPRGFGGGQPPPAAGQRPPGQGAPPALQGERAPGQAPLPHNMIMNQRAPDWTVIAGPSGPQWVYKGWHMVYLRKGDRPGSTALDGADARTWNSLKFVPPVPALVAPAGVAARFVGGAYALADKDGRVLFTGTCAPDCSGWTPLRGGYASRGLGEWSVDATGEHPQWRWRGKPVYVSQDADADSAPGGTTILRP